MDVTSQHLSHAGTAKLPPSNTAGVLPISTSGPKPKVMNSQAQSSRHNATGLKVVIRRLPPGLTEEELLSSLGEDWKVGGPRVDWKSFVPGKVSKDPAKHSRPARAYLHLSEDYIKTVHPGEKLKPLSDRLASIQLNDARGTFTDPALLNPWPSLSEAPYARIPSSKTRKDNRQGTIDQDQEFIDFLQELTNPVVKPTPIDSLPDKEAKPAEKIVTPLVQYLKEKKANKNKEPSSSGKAAKQSKADSKDVKANASAQEKKSSTKGTKSAPTDRKTATAAKAEKPAKEALKVLNKSTTASSNKTQQSSTPSAHSPAAASVAATPTADKKRERERGSAAAAAKILKRDLGLAGAPSGRRRREGSTTSSATSAKAASTAAAAPGAAQNANTQAQNTTASAQPVPSTAQSTTNSSESPKNNASVANSTTGKGQASNKQQSKSGEKSGKANANTSRAPASSSKTAQPAAPTATQAFLKHANPSQGITEPLLQATFAGFGIVTKVEIDKKKGFAYVDFAEPADLQKAISASPVKVGEGSVVVLERKVQQQGKRSKEVDNTSGRAASGSGGGGTGGGGRGSSQRSGRGRGRGGGKGAQTEGQAQPSTVNTSKPAGPSPSGSAPAEAGS